MATESLSVPENTASYRRRSSARVLLLNPAGEVLLFHFEHHAGPLAGYAFWATPGGGLQPGETPEQAAERELLEETGLVCHDGVGAVLHEREFPMTMPDGERVLAQESYFAVVLQRDICIDTGRWTPLERQVMNAHRWWSPKALDSTHELIAPRNLAHVLRTAGLWGA
jgi:8-oxo-dGTP diphosphatase